MKIAVIGPILNEAAYVGYSIMSVWDHVEEFVYAVSPKSSDGTIDILRHIAKRYGKVRLLLQSKYDFDPHNVDAYDASFNDCIDQTRCDAVWFLHPDMICTKWTDLKQGPLAWTTNITSYAGNLTTQITKGRATQWKNIHAKKFGLHYFGGYGSVNEDFYHSDITGVAYKHFGSEFSKYPFAVGTSGINVNHYCETKSYERRLEKMKLCLRTQNPLLSDDEISTLSLKHPRVTLEESDTSFGQFEFAPSDAPVPDVFTKHNEEFSKFQKEIVHV